MTSFVKLLRDVGYADETDKFYATVSTLFEEHFSHFKTDEQLKRQPREALRFCDLVRAQLKLPQLGDDLILGALENLRKRSRRKVKPK